MIFPSELIIYYSYQHPIAFADKDKLYVRPAYWSRRRGARRYHRRVIVEDCASEGEGTELVDDDNFLAVLKAALESYGISFAGTNSRRAANRNEAAKRRIVL